MRAIVMAAVVALVGCSAGSADELAGDDGAGSDDGAMDDGAMDDGEALPGTGDGSDVACVAGGATEVTLQTGDGLTLFADLWPSGIVGGPGVVLMHMIPPSNDRTNWPDEFAQSLADAGITVLNVDRRGAGDSEGVAEEAYSGPNGVLDAIAAYSALVGSQCEVPPDRIGFAGASNGTTSTLDFAVASADRDDLTPPAAIAWLTPGGYTENQNTLADHTDVLADMPILFMYSDAEAAFSNAAMPLDEGQWRFEELAGGGHGTNLFSTHPDETGALLREHFGSL